MEIINIILFAALIFMLKLQNYYIRHRADGTNPASDKTLVEKLYGD